MRSQRAHRRLYRLAAGVQYSALGMLTLLGAIRLATPQPDWPPLLAQALRFAQEWTWVALLTLAPLGAIARVCAEKLGTPWAVRAVEAILEELREHIFTDQCLHEPQHHHRVTLFKHVKCIWWTYPWRGRGKPCSGWLKPVARSGHTTQRTNTVFLAPDMADNAEGVAGVTWTKMATVRISNLPAIRAPEDAHAATYVEKSFTPPRLFRPRAKSEPKRLPRALCGIPVFANSEPWGVIVIDSRNPDGIREPADCATAIGIAQRLLENLLSNAK